MEAPSSQATPPSQPAEGSQPSRERGPDGKFAPRSADKPANGEPAKEAAPAPDAYASLAVPDGLDVDLDVLADAKGIFAELKIPPEKAQELVNLQARLEQKRLEGEINRQRFLTEQSKNDPEFGGLMGWPATESKLVAIRNLVGGKFIDALNAQGLGNHHEVIRGLLKLHDAAGLSEDRFVAGAKAPSQGMAATLYPNTPQMRD